MSAGRRAGCCVAGIGGIATGWALAMMVVTTIWRHQLEDFQDALEAVILRWDDTHPTADDRRDVS